MRQLVALGIVAMMVLAVPAADAVMNAFGGDVPENPPSVGIGASGAFASGDADEALSRIEALAAQSDAAPSWFEGEIGLPPHARDVRVSGRVVGYMVDGEAKETLAELENRMKGKGWTCVPMGGVDGVTCMKTSGACTWVVATCTQVGAATSVVMRCKLS